MKEVGIPIIEPHSWQPVDYDHRYRALPCPCSGDGRARRQTEQAEWEALVSRFQDTPVEVSAYQKWQLMERIFEIDQVR